MVILGKSQFGLELKLLAFENRYEAGTADIFFSTKQGWYLYQCTGRYGIYQPYRPVQYGIDFLGQYNTCNVSIYMFTITASNDSYLSLEQVLN